MVGKALIILDEFSMSFHHRWKSYRSGFGREKYVILFLFATSALGWDIFRVCYLLVGPSLCSGVATILAR